MAETKLDISNIKFNFSHITRDDVVQSWSEEPTPWLRWRDGILEQLYRRRGHNAFGRQIEQSEEWRQVPDAPTP